MKTLRKTIRKIILESQMSHEAKVIELITSWDIPSVEQALMLGETLGMFTVGREQNNSRERSIPLENVTPEFALAFEAHPDYQRGRRTQEYPMGEPYGIPGVGKNGSMWWYHDHIWLNVYTDPEWRDR